MGLRKPLPSPPDPLERWNLLTLAQLSEELPPIPWVCQNLRLAPGAVTLVAGYGYSRKTMAMQSLGLSVAAGKSAWGVWRVEQGTFVHLDYEQGRRLTQERYQRLARGMGFELSDLPHGALKVGVMPRAYLDEQGVFEDLCTIMTGARFVLIDSLRAAFPRADENSSEVRTYLDVLSRVSERTGAAIAVIHHARKPNAQNGGTATHAIRGSSSLFDACQSVFVFEGAKDTPTTVHHEKDRVMGSTLEAFGLTSEDMPGPLGPRDGLRVVHLEAAQLADAASSKDDAKEEQHVVETASRIITIVGVDGFRGSRADIRAQAHAKTKSFDVAWSRLVNGGFVVRHGSQREPAWSISEGNAHPLTHRSPNAHSISQVIAHPLTPPFREGEQSQRTRHTRALTHEDLTFEERGNLFSDLLGPSGDE